MSFFENETRFKDRLKPIKFKERLTDILEYSKRHFGFENPTLNNLIQTEGGVMAARMMLMFRDEFYDGFDRLMLIGGPSFTLEGIVLEFKNSGLFSEAEIDTAYWRLANYDLRDSDEVEISDPQIESITPPSSLQSAA
jgi:hypothetical protein